MKTIYNVKALCVVALLGSAAAASAQEDVTKEKNLNREMTLEREYDPSVQDASKVNTLPVVKEPEVRKIPIDYSNYTIAADPQKEISLLPSGNIMTQMDYNKRRGYFNFGMGTRMNINGDLGYHILSTEKDQLNLWYSHRSTNGKPKDYDVKAKINDNLGGINYKHAFEKTIFSIGAKYGYSAFNYYGAALSDPTSSYAPSEDLTLSFYAGNYDHKPNTEYAMEIQDMYVRLDNSIGDLLDLIDRKVGLRNTLFFITSTGYTDPEPVDPVKYKIPGGEFHIKRCAA